MNRVERIGITLFVLVLIVPTIVWGGIKALDFCGVNLVSFYEGDTGEKREKAQLSDDMTVVSIGIDLENYYNDRIPFRYLILKANRSLTGVVERPYNRFIEKKYTQDTIEDDKSSLEEDSQRLSVTTQIVTDEPESFQITESFWDQVDADTEEPITSDISQNIQECDAVEEQEIQEQIDDVIVQEQEVETELIMNEETSDVPLRIVNDKVVLGAQGWLFYGENRNIEYFRRTNLKNEVELANYAMPFIAIKTLCEMKDKQFRAIICPDKETIYPEYYPDVTREGDVSLAQQVVDYISENSSVKIFYPKTELWRYKKDYQLYYKHDSHWNAAGGYVGTKVLLDSLGFMVPSIEDIYTAPATIESGDLILLGGLSTEEYSNDTNYDIGYMMHVGIFSDDEFNADKARIEITSQSENPTYLVMVGDSCKMNMLRFIAANYDHVTFINKNALDDIASQDAIAKADVIVLEIAERNTNEFSTVAHKVHDILLASSSVE